MRIFLALLALFLAALSFGQSVRADGPTVFINESPVFTLKATLDGLTPTVRASRIAATLTANPPKLPLSVRSTERGIWIQSGETPVVRVTAQEAKLHGVGQAELASQWRRRVEEALELPPLSVTQTRWTVPVGGDQVVRLIGSEAARVTLPEAVSEFVSIEAAPGGVRLRGLKPGETEIDLKSPNGSTKLYIRVLATALIERGRLEAEVFGSPSSAAAVDLAVSGALRQGLKLAPDATLEVLDIRSEALPSGATRDVLARIRVRAPEAATFEGDVSVRVRNMGPMRSREKELWYSNVPESVREFGPLFESKLEANRPVRMLYHHVNATREPMVVQVVAYNVSPLPAQIQIIRGDGAPDSDPVRTGLDAADQFLRAWLQTSGEVITLPPRSRVPIALRRLGPNFTISGLAYLSLLPGSGESVTVRTEAMRPSQLDATWTMAMAGASPWAGAAPLRTETLPRDLPQSPHIFVNPFRDLQAEYRVGGRFTFVRIGQKPIESANEELELQGNFGVLYTVNARLENPSSQVSRVEIVFEASAGYSGGLFVVDGVVNRTNVIQSKAEVPLKVVRLAPGEVRDIRIMTIPLSGSSYPATLVLRPHGASGSTTAVASSMAGR